MTIDKKAKEIAVSFGAPLSSFEDTDKKLSEIKDAAKSKIVGGLVHNQSTNFDEIDQDKFFDEVSFIERNRTLDTIISDSISITQKKFESELENYLKRNLATIGLTFSSTTDWLFFVKDRVSRVESSNSVEVEYYLDYNPFTQKGLLIGVTNEKQKTFKTDTDGRMTITIG
jgi:hypothetical protein